ncbi:MAG: radical SAM protein [Candidatus Muiribacteriaceae bacterium]
MREIDITLELSNKCNLSCPMCTLAEKDVLSPQLMPLKTAEKFVNDISQSRYVVNVLRLFWAGEPLLNPDFSDILGTVSGCTRIKRISFDTNGLLLESSHCRKITECAAHGTDIHIMFSIDSFDPDLYARIRTGGDISRVCRNISDLLEHIRRSGTDKNIHIALQFIIMPENSDYIGDYISRAIGIFKNCGYECDIMLNESMAKRNGVNLRPLTIQDEDKCGINQQASNMLYENILRSLGLIGDNRKISSIIQGGGGLYYE